MGRNVVHSFTCVGLLWAASNHSTLGDFTIVAIGDWGGNSASEPTTLSQRLTAQGLQAIAEDFDANFTLMMGDNFYEHGIHQDEDECSSRFHDTFQAVYADGLPGRPFYAMAGNHDYGEGREANVSAQIAYSSRSQQWRFPDLWYKIHRDFEASGEARSLDILVIDTVVLCGNGAAHETFIDQALEFRGELADRSAPGRLRQATASDQWAWLERELAASRADYLWVTGHYPIWSAGNDGSTQCLIDRLIPLLKQHGAHYISGHDHMLEHFAHEGLHSFVIGAGKECCYSATNWDPIPGGAMKYMLAGHHGSETLPFPAPFPVHGGFASLRFGAAEVTVLLHAHNGSVIYSAPAISARVRRSTSFQHLSVSTQIDGLSFFCISLAYVVGNSVYKMRNQWQLQWSAPLLA